MGSIYEIYGSDAREMTMRLMDAAGIAARIPAGASIALKPNLVVAHAPETGATTHAGVLEGVIEYLQEHGHNKLCIMEGAWVGDSTQRGFSVCGYDKLGKRFNVPLYDLKKDKFLKVDTAVGQMSISERALHTDYFINLPVLKGHCQTTMTCALKNLKGCLPDFEKRNFHAQGLVRPIAALAAALKPALTIVDSICGDLNFEEGGTPVQTNRMLLGFDPVQLDAYCCRLMGISTDDVGYISLAEQFGAGSMAYADEDIVRINEPDGSVVYPRPSGLVARLTRNVDARSACSACYGNLVHALYRMEREKHKTVRDVVCIGQEFRGQPVDGIGIGRCCACAKINVPGCPPAAGDIMRMLEENA